MARLKSARRSRVPDGFISTEIESPYEHPSGKKFTEKVYRRVSDNALLWLFSRSKISESQFLAGNKYMNAHVITTGQAGHSIDYSKQRVDTSLSHLTLSEKQMTASDIIRNANRELMVYGVNDKNKIEAVLRMQKIAGEGYSVTDYCKDVWGKNHNKIVSKQLINFKKDLDVLAEYWGLMN